MWVLGGGVEHFYIPGHVLLSFWICDELRCILADIELSFEDSSATATASLHSPRSIDLQLLNATINIDLFDSRSFLISYSLSTVLSSD